MAGDGGRVPDVSEQRAEVDVSVRRRCAFCEGSGWLCDGCQRPEALCMASTCRGAALSMSGCPNCYRPGECGGRGYVVADPASVLAALLAENPEATVAALEALLTSDEVVTTAEESLVASARSCLSDAEAATFALSAACRSLLPKTPKEDGNA